MLVYFETYGCTANRSDTDLMKGLAREKGHEIANSPEEADLVVVNTCTVIKKTQDRILSRLRDLKKISENLVVAGCMASAQPELLDKYLSDFYKIEPRKITDFLNNSSSCEKQIKFDNKLSIPCSPSGVIGRVQISEGCLGNCSYCITKNARGDLFSFPEKDVVEKVEELVEKGAKEIQITAQDTAAYGRDIGSDLPSLIDKITDLNKDFKIRIGMMNPFNLKDIRKEVIEMFKEKKIYNFLHLPVQSGSDRVLDLMNRNYSRNFFLETVKMFKKEIGGTVSTDFIAGFPKERDKDFKKTVDLIHKIKPDIINITRFSPRPGTKADDYKEVKSAEKKERSKKLTELRKKYGKKNKERYLGSELDVLVTKEGKKDSFIGRDKNYNPVVVHDNVSIGDEVKVKISDIHFAYLEGEKN
ncbi:MAG: 2-methylthioadenine synthetase [Candidatus Methanohalarchaeum thermophilum]|uniref:tRNA-t(6)A37 methylthiotransferase n=1 Tax=Methanohalarchaeum thermophilum TaxID=1903181 RepID=A0A1Q6DVQ1_METT1|nr:MAG: 2-methylthioadenine synthetase [Candidatus Methanohalarchaeum thermophilum]